MMAKIVKLSNLNIPLFPTFILRLAAFKTEQKLHKK